MEHDACKVSEIQVSEKDESFVCDLFKMLGEASRLKIVCALMGTRMCVAHLAEQVEMEQSAVSHQLRNLKQTGLVKSEKKGKQVFYSLDDDHVFTIVQQAVAHVRHLKGEA
jgi:DNA-binding transcriptional ArsR family regulator